MAAQVIQIIGNIFPGVCLSTGWRGVSFHGREVFVRGSLFGTICPGGLCLEGLCSGRFLSRGLCLGGQCHNVKELHCS